MRGKQEDTAASIIRHESTPKKDTGPRRAAIVRPRWQKGEQDMMSFYARAKKAVWSEGAVREEDVGSMVGELLSLPSPLFPWMV
ncbi:hypothetical protein EYF80_033410 [Liparis tanakae]|uniref:Uncharacterized protein n=1 Tax=Liparis tanakae TaxID=230148 RepID=A0A4Z2GUU8_9TELE|nr:hypothetical protein EYF80_033410 [Liparis tanakae]